ncbi:hypothetical protein EV662_107174 [Rhodovulum marinum]|uniref:Uncharacterized protein n=1 Tax=Rhodovulum marinum TaxID=320662 RepID=A0A4R2PWN9_9RHOB|nr:hypothetical protein EV662_107174 [Rhodovulum marinum]
MREFLALAIFFAALAVAPIVAADDPAPSMTGVQTGP